MLFDKGNTDRFSWIVDDYVALANQFQGVFTAFGFRRSNPVQITSQGDIIIYVESVIENSAAANAGMQRGDIIYAVNDIAMNLSNYSEVLSLLANETANAFILRRKQWRFNPYR